MTKRQLNFPTDLDREVCLVAERQGISVDEFVLWAVAEKIGRLSQVTGLDNPNYPDIGYKRTPSGDIVPVIRGTDIRVRFIGKALQQWGMTIAELIEEYEIPERLIKEALDYYDFHIHPLKNKTQQIPEKTEKPVPELDIPSRPPIDLNDPNKLLKAGDIAKVLGISRTNAYLLMRRGEIPTVHVGKAVRVKGEDLKVFIEKSRKNEYPIF